MKPLLHSAVAALIVATVLALANAQSRPDFSGRWKISQAKSSAGATGNSARIGFPSELVIKQNAGELHVEMIFPRSDPLTAVYKFDGSEVTIGLTAGVTEKAKAVWEGDKLAVTSRRVITTAFGDFVADNKEMWSLSGNILSIAKTQSADGLTANETAVFDKAQ